MNTRLDKIKTGILGGTFDPIHIGHIQMALCAADEWDLEEVWLMPNGSPPHKNDRLVAATPSARCTMTQLAIEDTAAGMEEKCPLVLCDYEIKRRKTSYSYETMEHFNEVYPDRAFYFIIGADSLNDLTKWMKPERLVRTCVILAAVRGDADTDSLLKKIEEYRYLLPGSDIGILHMPAVEVSSTHIREMIGRGDDISSLVTPSVAKYIQDHPALYHHKN